jgi:ArsR family transcriptional regulator, cadmium/lead-responsive transcriptional repressor
VVSDPATTGRALSDAPFALPELPVETDLLAKYFRALGDPTRLRILELLADGERSVGELVEAVGRPQPKVSDHLACLRWCGFVTSRRAGRRILYEVADERVGDLIAGARALLADNAEHLAACHRIDGSSC